MHESTEYELSVGHLNALIQRLPSVRSFNHQKVGFFRKQSLEKVKEEDKKDTHEPTVHCANRISKEGTRCVAIPCKSMPEATLIVQQSIIISVFQEISFNPVIISINNAHVIDVQTRTGRHVNLNEGQQTHYL